MDTNHEKLIVFLAGWIDAHFEPSDKRFSMSSYFLKHAAERDYPLYIPRRALEATFERLGFRVAEEIVGAKYYFCKLRRGHKV